jgi:hypothetical protein
MQIKPQRQIRETSGPTTLTFGALPDGSGLVRDGSDIVDFDGTQGFAVGSEIGKQTATGSTVAGADACSWTVIPGTYTVEAVLQIQTSLTTVGAQFAFQGSGGLVVSVCDGAIASSNATFTTQHSNITGTSLPVWSAQINGPGLTTVGATVTALIVVTTGGTLTLRYRTEGGATGTTNLIAGYATCRRLA